MKIKLLVNYGGNRTNEQRILPGVYDSTEPALFGLAEYLVKNGHATVLEENTPKPPVEAQKETVTPQNTAIERLRKDYEKLAGTPAKKSWSKNKIQAELDKLTT